MKKWFLAVLAISAISVPGFADSSRSADQILDRLVGHWVLSGTIAGRNTTHDVFADWVLNHGYLRIHEVSREVGLSGAPAYEAMVLISFGMKSGDYYTCLWLDSTGNGGLVPEGLGHAKLSGDSIPFVFCDSAGRTSFENTFSYDRGADAWSWVMNNVEDGKRLPFGRVTLVRQLGTPDSIDRCGCSGRRG
jgi:hypothetical protein